MRAAVQAEGRRFAKSDLGKAGSAIECHRLKLSSAASGQVVRNNHLASRVSRVLQEATASVVLSASPDPSPHLHSAPTARSVCAVPVAAAGDRSVPPARIAVSPDRSGACTSSSLAHHADGTPHLSASHRQSSTLAHSELLCRAGDHMMDGRNCTGRTISLLNDSGSGSSRHLTAAVDAKRARSSQPFPATASTSSSLSSPTFSPQLTPDLVRTNSDYSTTTCATPSPLTPNALPRARHPQHQQYFLASHHPQPKMDDPNASLYPPIPNADPSGMMPSPYAMPPQVPQQFQHMPLQYRPTDSPSVEPPHIATLSAPAASKSQGKKNQYPCPMAKQIGCTDFFTTSGHAARHAKKHTGKKDAYCPECNKAFTRKDNMEQHRRTHQNGRGASRSTKDEAKVTKPSKQPPAKRLKTELEPQLEAAVEQVLAEQQQMEVRVQDPMQTQLINRCLSFLSQCRYRQYYRNRSLNRP